MLRLPLLIQNPGYVPLALGHSWLPVSPVLSQVFISEAIRAPGLGARMEGGSMISNAASAAGPGARKQGWRRRSRCFERGMPPLHAGSGIWTPRACELRAGPVSATDAPRDLAQVTCLHAASVSSRAKQTITRPLPAWYSKRVDSSSALYSGYHSQASLLLGPGCRYNTNDRHRLVSAPGKCLPFTDLSFSTSFLRLPLAFWRRAGGISIGFPL